MRYKGRGRSKGGASFTPYGEILCSAKKAIAPASYIQPDVTDLGNNSPVLIGLSRSDIVDAARRPCCKARSVAGLYLDLLGHFSAGVDPVALESAEDAIEAALFNPEPAFQGLNHLPMGMRVFQVHIERGRIGGANPFKSSLAAPEFHAALEVRVEDPHAIPLHQRPWMEPGPPEAILFTGQDKGEARAESECEDRLLHLLIPYSNLKYVRLCKRGVIGRVVELLKRLCSVSLRNYCI